MIKYNINNIRSIDIRGDFAMIWIWLVIMVVFMIVEAATLGLTSIWFALGALAAFISSAVHAPLLLQILWFLVVSVVAIVATRPLARKYVNAKREPTNADRVLNRVGVVIERIDNSSSSGRVSVDGRVWTARSDTEMPIEEGKEVRALRIEGVKLIVSEVESEEQNESCNA